MAKHTISLTTPAVYAVPSAGKPPAGLRPASRGLRSWLPALSVVLALPVLALATAKYVLLPSVRLASAPSATLLAQNDTILQQASVYVVKLPLAGKAGSSFSDFKGLTLIGAQDSLQNEVNLKRPELVMAARESLQAVNVADLERPGALEDLRAQLLVKMNKILGDSHVKEVYLTVTPH
jgi:flagellar basal body-associated protein FliL